MRTQKKIPVLAGLFVLTIAGVAATTPVDEGESFKNLKVLSKNINEEQLERIMYAFDRQLGVTCVYCHAPTKNITPERIDFASDEKKEKRAAREMLKMTMRINKKYFNVTIDKKLLTKPLVWCRTCHRGYPVPHIQ